MAEITENDLGATAWATSSDVQGDFQIEVSNQPDDFERRIRQATRRVRAWYRDATGQDPPDQPPDLLRDATSMLAASLAHQAFAMNISGENDGDERHVFMEDMARDFFEDWKAEADIGAEDESSGEASENVTGVTGVIGGERRSPIDRTPKEDYDNTGYL